MTTIIETARVGKAPDTLWHEIGQFGAVGRWHPLLSKVASEGEREGCLRTAEGRDGSRQTERLLKTTSKRHCYRYRYRMEETAMPVHNYTAELRVDDNRDGTSTVVWSAQFEPTADTAKTVESIRGFLKAGLDNIARLHGSVPP
jgi:hypothetical protein